MGCIRPDVTGVVLKGKRGRILTCLNLAAGEGPHPVVLALHGIPGNEQNGDLIHELQDMGMDVVSFHYSGCLGSDGSYRLKNNLEDTNTVLDFILHDTEYGFDTSRIYVVGHSLGGFHAACLAATRSELRAFVLAAPCNVGEYEFYRQENPRYFSTLQDILVSSVPFLQDVTLADFEQELLAWGDRYRFRTIAPKLARLPALLVTGTLDTACPGPDCCPDLIRGIREAGGTQLQLAELPADHSFLQARRQFLDLVENFLQQQN